MKTVCCCSWIQTRLPTQSRRPINRLTPGGGTNTNMETLHDKGRKFLNNCRVLKNGLEQLVTFVEENFRIPISHHKQNKPQEH